MSISSHTNHTLESATRVSADEWRLPCRPRHMGGRGPVYTQHPGDQSALPAGAPLSIFQIWWDREAFTATPRGNAEACFTIGNRTEFTSGDGAEKNPPTLRLLIFRGWRESKSCEILGLHYSEWHHTSFWRQDVSRSYCTFFFLPLLMRN